ncbi:hypothetical protein [Caballeronia novacaledonica]|uniref:hypothetical protein n=1 Tax=Caballeronia novacaledonica TaxID=1544861 RepID=UPI0011B1E560|nr:hypothetical protein [Caballeronia novacaledonica]
MNTQYAHAASSCVPCPGRHRGSNECESSPRPTLNSSRFPYARLFVGVLIGLFCKIYAARTTNDRAAFQRTDFASDFLLLRASFRTSAQAFSDRQKRLNS